MEVEVLGVDGAPEDAIVSIRAGSCRRQALVSALTSNGTPFRFASGLAGVSPFKVDLLQPLGTARLALKSGGSGTYTMPLVTPDGDGPSVTLAVRELGSKSNEHQDLGQDFFDRIDIDKDGVISRQEFAQAIRQAEGGKPVLQPLDNGAPLGLHERGGGTRLPALVKDGDNFPAAAADAKKYLDSHNLLPFVRSLLQTVIREQPDDPFTFIADQFRAAATTSVAQNSHATPAAGPVPSPSPLPNLGSTLFPHLPSTGTWLQRLPAQRSLPLMVRGISEGAAGEAEGPQPVLQQALANTTPGRPQVKGPVSAQLTPKEMEAAREQARCALASALLAEPALPGTEEIDVGARARDALASALLGPEASAGGAGAEAATSVPTSEAEMDSCREQARIALESALLQKERDDPDRGDEVEEEEEEEDEELELERLKAQAQLSLTAALIEKPLEEAKQLARDALTATLLLDRASEDDSFKSHSGGELQAAKEMCCEALVAALGAEGTYHQEQLEKHARVALESALLSRERDDPEEGDEMEEAEEEEEEKSEQEEEEDDDDQELEHLKALAQRSLGTAFITKPLDEAKQLAKDALAAALLLDRASEDDRFKGCPSEDIQAAKTRCREALVAALDTEVLDRQVQLEEAMELARDALTCALATEQHVTPEEYENSKAEAREAMVKALNVTPQHRQVSLIGEDVESSKSACRDAIKRALLGGAGDEEAEGKEVDPHAKEAEEMESFDEMRTKLVATREDMTTFNASLKAEVNELKHSLNGLMKERDLLKSRLLSSGVLQ